MNHFSVAFDWQFQAFGRQNVAQPISYHCNIRTAKPPAPRHSPAREAASRSTSQRVGDLVERRLLGARAHRAGASAHAVAASRALPAGGLPTRLFTQGRATPWLTSPPPYTDSWLHMPGTDTIRL